MKVETIYNDIRYVLSNDNLKVGDKVYCIGRGRVVNNNELIFHEFDFRNFISGFPDDPDIIENLNYSEYKPYEVKTDKGWSPKESYFKIIKKEKQIELNRGKFKSYKWVEMN